MFVARMEALRPMADFLATFCTAAGIPRPQLLRLNLVLEELFTNTVRHGHKGDSEAPIWVTLEARPEAVRVTYEDVAPPFNPYAQLHGQAPDSTLERMQIGGLGVLLTNELATSRDYAFLFGRNRIRLTLKRA